VTLSALVAVTVLVVLAVMAVIGYLVDRDAGRRESGPRQ